MAVLKCPACDVLWGSTNDMVPTDPTCWVCGAPTGVPPTLPRYDRCSVCGGFITDTTRHTCSPSGRPRWQQIIHDWTERSEREARRRSEMAGLAD